MNNSVPTGWSLQPLSALAHYYNGRAFKPEDWSSEGLPIIRIAQINNKNTDLDYYAGDDVSDKNRIINGDLLFSWSATLTALIWNRGDAVLNQHIFKVEEKAGVDRKYLHQVILNSIEPLADYSHGSTMKHIKKGVLDEYCVGTPPLHEQQKIATILSSVDNVIEKTRAQIDKLKDLKTGMMQELLTKGIGHTEFKDSPVGRIPVEWDVVHLESLVSIMESGWSPQCDSVPAKGCEWAVLKTTAVSWDGFDFTANKKLPDELEPRPKIQVEVHDILITRAGPAERVGVVSYVEHVPRRIMLSDKLIRIKAHHNQNPQFLSFWLSTEFVRNYFSQRTTGLAQSQTNISQDILKSLLCVVPPLAEQETISSTISALEKQLMTKRNILSHYEKMKKALMQDLLAGKVRVKLNESAVQ